MNASTHPRLPHGRTTLVAVFPSERITTVRERLRSLRVAADSIHTDVPDDERRSLRAEQDEEVRRSFVSPQMGLALPKETKSLIWTLPIAAILGALILMPFAFIEVGGMTFRTRLFWFAVLGAAAFLTAAFIITTAMSVKDPFEPGAAQRGVVLRISDDRPDVEDALVEAHPIRLDRYDADGHLMATVVTEEDRESGGALGELADNFRREQHAKPTERHR